MITRFWKHEDGRRWVEFVGSGYVPLFGSFRWHSAFRFDREKHGLIECDADWQPLKPVVREWVSDKWLLEKSRWRKEGDGPLMYFDDVGNCRKSAWTVDTMGSEFARPYEVHPGTRIPIDKPLPSPPCDVVPANEAKPTAEKTELDECIEWLESPAQQAAKLSFACSMVTNGLREVNRRIDNIERRLGIKG